MPDETHLVETTKGWRIPLRRYRPHGESRFRPPVVLCHGLGANHLNFDWEAPHGLAQHLAAEGHDCWVMGLRGSRGSVHLGDPAHRWQIDFDDYLAGDAASAVEFVRERTDSPRARWVGHSLGGLIGLASSALPEPIALDAVVSLGAGITYGRRPAVASLLRTVARAARWLTGEPRIPQARLAQLESPLMGRLPLPSFLSPPGVAPELIRRLHAHVAEDMPAPVIEQLADWLDRGEVASTDGRVSYTRALSRLDAAVMLLGGGADTWSPPETLRDTHRTLRPRARAGSVHGGHEIHVLERKSGATTDYGHVDVVFGEGAPTEIFPRVHAFLRRTDHD